MARRRDRSFDGRRLAGEAGDLFVSSDGVEPLFDADAGDCFPDRVVAAAAWHRARHGSWAHETREDVWPPVGAEVYDGLTAHSRHVGPNTAGARAAVEADLASVTSLRRDKTDAASESEPYLQEYETALEVLLGLVDTGGDVDAWHRATQRREESHGAA